MTFYYPCILDLPNRFPTMEELTYISAWIGIISLCIGILAAIIKGLMVLIRVIWPPTPSHVKENQSQAAALVLSKMNICIRDIKEIGYKYHGYQYPSFLQVPRGEKDEKPHPERPSRLIDSKIDQLNREVEEAVAILAEPESKKISKLLSDLKNHSLHLGPAIYADLTDKFLRDLPQTRKILDEFPNELNRIEADAKEILKPIIDFKDK